MRQKFVVRLLTAAGELLAWAEVYAEAKPQGRPRSTPFFASTPTLFAIEQHGEASQIAVHWCDLDVARLFQLPEPVDVATGQVLKYDWFTMPVWLVEGSKVDVPLPTVTIKQSVKVTPPTGNLAAVGNR
jgi:hypothetical protein